MLSLTLLPAFGTLSPYCVPHVSIIREKEVPSLTAPGQSMAG